MIIGMFGSRHVCDEKIIANVLKCLKQKLGNNLQIIVGDCIGVDEIVYRCCKELGIDVKVLKVWSNWDKISYEPDANDIMEVVGKGVKRLRARLRMRSIRLVEVVQMYNGVLIGFNVNGKGSRLVIREGLKRGVRMIVINEKR